MNLKMVDLVMSVKHSKISIDMNLIRNVEILDKVKLYHD